MALGIVQGSPFVFVVDTGNHRILAFAADINFVPLNLQADFVIGQSDFDHPGGGTTDVLLNGPRGVAFDNVSEMLFVSDKDNSRVLGYDMSGAGISSGMSASVVLGQADFNSGSSNAGGGAHCGKP